MKHPDDEAAKATRLRRLKGLVVAGTAGLGLVLWGVVSGAVAASTAAAAAPSAQPVTQEFDDDSGFFAQDSPAGLGATNAQPMTRTGGS